MLPHYHFHVEAHQQGFIVIPKSVSEQRIISNSEVFDFELSTSEMEEVRSRNIHAEALLMIA
jgi:diketogulonate reductase-like aldo/keto reductase